MEELSSGGLAAALQAALANVPPEESKAPIIPSIKRDPDSDAPSPATATSANGDLTSPQVPLKRARAENEETADDTQSDSKRPKIEPEADADAAGGLDIEAMLKSALDSMSSELPAPAAAPASSSTPPTALQTTEVAASPSVVPQGPPPIGLAAGTTNGVQSGASGASSQELKMMRFSQNPTYISRSMGLPLLGNFAVQLLYALSEKPRNEAVPEIALTDSEPGRVYKALRDAFRHTRKLFSAAAPILQTEELDIKELGDQETIQMANMATISASVFDADDVPLIDVHDHFLMTFLPESGTLTKELAVLFLSLKHRTLAAELVQLPDREQRGAFLERLFPANLEDQLRQLHPELPLSEHEMTFLKDMMAAKEQLLEAAKTDESRNLLIEQYPLDSFRDELSAFLIANKDVILRYAESHGIEIPGEEESTIEDAAAASETVAFDAMGDSIASMLSAAIASSGDVEQQGGEAHATNGNTVATGAAPQGPVADGGAATQPADSGLDLSGLTNLIKAKLGQDAQNTHPPAAAATVPTAMAQSPYGAMGLTALSPAAGTHPNMQASFGNNQLGNQRGMYQNRPPPAAPAYAYQSIHIPQQNTAQLATNGNGALPPNQSSPSAILYQQARQAAATKTQVHTRREGLHSTRRPWSPDEEQALMAGLDMVKGPHWSQILQLFGANGTISDILKDRSQVQLKDKARNLKLFFLKANTEMPYYLKCVTGELKTRAPSQAARKEAEERARANNKEEQARVQGIMMLAGGLQDKNQSQTSSSAAGSPAVAINDVGAVNASDGFHLSAASSPAPSASPIRPAVAIAANPPPPPAAAVAMVAPSAAAGLATNSASPVSRIPSASQLSPALQLQLQQQIQQQLQQRTGVGAAVSVPRTPVTAADVARAAAKNGLTATAQALSSRVALTPAGTAGPAMTYTPATAASSVTAGMTAALNAAISNAAAAARPSPAPVRPKNSSMSPAPPHRPQSAMSAMSAATAHATSAGAAVSVSQGSPSTLPAATAAQAQAQTANIAAPVQRQSLSASPAPASVATQPTIKAEAAPGAAKTNGAAATTPTLLPASTPAIIHAPVPAPALDPPQPTPRPQWQQAEETSEEAVIRRLLAPEVTH